MFVHLRPAQDGPALPARLDAEFAVMQGLIHVVHVPVVCNGYPQIEQNLGHEEALYVVI